jgi:glycosyltransferase involved in cell wall biosynthesis
MRIGINTRFLIQDNLEGVGWYTHEICKRIVRNHPEIEFFFFFDRPYSEKFIFAENVTPVVLGPPARHPFLWYVWFEHSIKNALEEHKIDVFFSPDGFLSLSTSVPTMITCHDLAYLHYPKQIPFLIRKYFIAYLPKFHHKAAFITAVSNATKQDIIKHYKIKEEKILVAHNACRDHFKPINKDRIDLVRNKLTGGAPYFVYLGSINPRKNIPNLIRAFEELKSEESTETKLVILGKKGWNNQEFEKVLKKSKYKEDIIIKEEVGSEVFNIVGAATCMVYISYFEGFGIPILEAMTSGVPVICSNVSSMPEVAGDAALLINPKKIKSIKRAMKKICFDEDLRKELIAKGLVQSKKFNWDRSADAIGKALLNLYQQP